MKRNYWVKVMKEEFFRNTCFERVLANVKAINEAVKFLEEIAESCEFEKLLVKCNVA
ncbi:hypothetical protein N4T77_00625 [Clostridium sp. CX1]|uniref:hypothetical protein n=1 Tax=Clostridium sp. CX1 TaxID=2978346 RepID=UPI0021C1134F|nr:hypothetical protein [Clostridium sp. CX1]MCT8975094.1 hypothetical protein [Clostridium sp. CX1]